MNYWDKLMGDDEHAASYMDTYGEGVDTDTRKVIASLLEPGDTVLDVGCGPGWNLDHFKKYEVPIAGYRGLDYSERFVRVANARHGNNPPRFRLGDCRKLKEGDKTWSTVILQDVLEHTNGYQKPVEEALRVARRCVIVTFWRMNDSETKTNDDGDDGYGSDYNRAEWEEYLNSLGLKWTHTTTPPGANRFHDYYIIYKVKKG